MVKFEGGNARPNRMAVKKSDISLILKNNTKVLNNQWMFMLAKLSIFLIIWLSDTYLLIFLSLNHLVYCLFFWLCSALVLENKWYPGLETSATK